MSLSILRAPKSGANVPPRVRASGRRDVENAPDAAAAADADASSAGSTCAIGFGRTPDGDGGWWMVGVMVISELLQTEDEEH